MAWKGVSRLSYDKATRMDEKIETEQNIEWCLCVVPSCRRKSICSWQHTGTRTERADDDGCLPLSLMHVPFTTPRKDVKRLHCDDCFNFTWWWKTDTKDVPYNTCILTSLHHRLPSSPPSCLVSSGEINHRRMVSFKHFCLSNINSDWYTDAVSVFLVFKI